MRIALLLLAALSVTSGATATSWIARSFAGLLHDADAVVVGEVGEVTHRTAEFRVLRVLSGQPGRTLMLPVVRCNEPGPNGTQLYRSGCLDRTYQSGERLLLLLSRDPSGGLRETGHPSGTRYSLPSDAEDRARRLLALSDTDARARADALADMLADPRPDWQFDAAEAADPSLTSPIPNLSDLAASVYQRTVDRLTLPLLQTLQTGATGLVRDAAAGALGWSRVESAAVTQALLDALSSPDPGLFHSAADALRSRRDPRAADLLAARALASDDPDRQSALLGALAPVVRTDHAGILAQIHRQAGPYEKDGVLRVWVLTGDPAAADVAAQQLADADRWRADAALEILGRSRDRRYAHLALDRLQPVVCDEAAMPSAALAAAPLLAHPEDAFPAVAAYFACASSYVRWQAVQALGQIDLPVSRAALVAQRHTEVDPETLSAIDALVGALQPDERAP